MNLILHTIPHTGTNFVEKFLNTLGVTESIIRIHVTQLDDAEIVSQYHLAQLKMLASSRPTIITARDPYLSAIRLLQREHRTMALLKKRWDRFFKTIPTMNCHIIDRGEGRRSLYAFMSSSRFSRSQI